MRGPTETLPGTPGEALLKLFMQPLGLTAYRVATDIEVPPIAISEILRGLRSISPVMALKLGMYFGVSPAFWMALQAAHELKLAAAAVESVMKEGGNHPAHVQRCAALSESDQAFAVKEAVDASGHRSWQVLLVKTRKPQAKSTNPANSETSTTRSDAASAQRKRQSKPAH